MLGYIKSSVAHLERPSNIYVWVYKRAAVRVPRLSVLNTATAPSAYVLKWVLAPTKVVVAAAGGRDGGRRNHQIFTHCMVADHILVLSEEDVFLEILQLLVSGLLEEVLDTRHDGCMAEGIQPTGGLGTCHCLPELVLGMAGCLCHNQIPRDTFGPRKRGATVGKHIFGAVGAEGIVPVMDEMGSDGRIQDDFGAVIRVHDRPFRMLAAV